MGDLLIKCCMRDYFLCSAARPLALINKFALSHCFINRQIENINIHAGPIMYFSLRRGVFAPPQPICVCASAYMSHRLIGTCPLSQCVRNESCSGSLIVNWGGSMVICQIPSLSMCFVCAKLEVGYYFIPAAENNCRMGYVIFAPLCAKNIFAHSHI